MELINSQRISQNVITANFSLDKDTFTVEWNNIHPATGEELEFDLQVGVKSTNEDLAERVSEAIKSGEDDDNIDLDLYLFIRDSFDMTLVG